MSDRDVHPAASTEGPQHVALALSGGGFLSLASFAGLTAALLRTLGRAQGKDRPTLATAGVFSNFTTLSTVSGGSWFLAELAYSPSFRKLIEDMAASPAEAGELFTKRWVEPWISTFKGTSGFLVDQLVKIANFFGKHGIAQDIALISYLWQMGLTWNNFIVQLLGSTADINPETQLGAPVEKWAQGKTWLVGHTLVTPSDEVPGFLSADAFGNTRYSADLVGPTYVPAKFSIELGTGRESHSPLPYCAEGAIGANCRFAWKTPVGGCLFCGSQTHEATSEAVGRFASFTEKAGALPLTAVVGCSSAFLGGLVLNEEGTKLQTILQGSFPVWGALTAGADAFQAAEALLPNSISQVRVSPEMCDALADKSVCAFIDGVYTENSGIAHAVAAGASEVTTFHSTDLNDLLHLFQGAETEEGGFLTFRYYPIFAEQHSQIREQIEGFAEFAMPQNARFLQGVLVGSLRVNTVQNDAFGIAAGRAVTLHVVKVKSSLTIGFNQDFREYGKQIGHLVQEFSEALEMPQNSGLVDKILGMMVPSVA